MFLIRKVKCMRFCLGLPMETVEPRCAGSRDDIEARPFVIQVHCVYRDVRHVQTVWESRLLGAQCSSETSDGQEEQQRAFLALLEVERLAVETA